METFGEKISAEACSGKEIARDDDEYDDTKILKSRMSGFSRGKLEAGGDKGSKFISTALSGWPYKNKTTHPQAQTATQSLMFVVWIIRGRTR